MIAQAAPPPAREASWPAVPAPPAPELPVASLPPRAVAARDERELRKIATDFESLFSQMLMSSMRKTVQKSPLFHGGRGEEIFSEILDTHYAKAMSSRGKGLGLADMIVKKYQAHVHAQAASKGRFLDQGGAPAAAGAPGGSRS